MELIIEYIEISPEKFQVKNNSVKRLVASLFKEENKSPENLCIVFCTDRYIREVNKKYLKHDFFTDVITFAEHNKNKISGNIFISYETVLNNSLKYSGGNFNIELYRVIIHGLLHLIGYCDTTIASKSLMTQKENYYLNKLSLHF